MSRQIINKIVAFNSYNLDGKLDDVIAKLQQTLEGVPIEYRHTAMMNVSTGYDDSSIDVDVSYSRPETDEEMKDREERSAAYNKQVCERDRRQYEELKKRFG